MKLPIEKAVYGGSGLAHQTEGEGAGRAVFVPFTLPGELVEARLTGEEDGFGEAALVQVDLRQSRVIRTLPYPWERSWGFPSGSPSLARPGAKRPCSPMATPFLRSVSD